MIEIISGLPDDTVGYRLSGKVTADDYRKVIQPAVDAVLETHDKLKALIVEDSDTELSSGAIWQDMKLGLANPLSWRKMAMVSDQGWWRRLTPLVSAMMPGEIKSFETSELEAAKAWLAAD